MLGVLDINTSSILSNKKYLKSKVHVCLWKVTFRSFLWFVWWRIPSAGWCGSCLRIGDALWSTIWRPSPIPCGETGGRETHLCDSQGRKLVEGSVWNLISKKNDLYPGRVLKPAPWLQSCDFQTEVGGRSFYASSFEVLKAYKEKWRWCNGPWPTSAMWVGLRREFPAVSVVKRCWKYLRKFRNIENTAI